MRIEICRAVPADSERATKLARAAKAHWGYPAEWLKSWESGLAITPQDIANHPTYVASLDDEVVGVCQLKESDAHSFLEHIWVDPRCHRRGAGPAAAVRREDEVVGGGRWKASAAPSFLEHIWVAPRCPRRGVGRALVEHARGS